MLGTQNKVSRVFKHKLKLGDDDNSTKFLEKWEQFIKIIQYNMVKHDHIQYDNDHILTTES